MKKNIIFLLLAFSVVIFFGTSSKNKKASDTPDSLKLILEQDMISVALNDSEEAVQPCFIEQINNISPKTKETFKRTLCSGKIFSTKDRKIVSYREPEIDIIIHFEQADLYIDLWYKEMIIISKDTEETYDISSVNRALLDWAISVFPKDDYLKAVKDSLYGEHPVIR